MSDEELPTRKLFNKSMRGDRLSLLSLIIGLASLAIFWWLGGVLTIFSFLWIRWTYTDWKKLNSDNRSFGQFLKEIFYDNPKYDLIPKHIDESKADSREFISKQIQDIKLEPNIVYIESNNVLTAFSESKNYWEESVIGEPSLVIKFGNEPLADRRVGELGRVNAQIGFYNKKATLVHSVDDGIWLDTGGSVWFHFGKRQKLLIFNRSPNGRIWVAERVNSNRKELNDRYYRVNVRLIGDNQWVKNFHFTLTIDKKGNASIDETD